MQARPQRNSKSGLVTCCRGIVGIHSQVDKLKNTSRTPHTHTHLSHTCTHTSLTHTHTHVHRHPLQTNLDIIHLQKHFSQ